MINLIKRLLVKSILFKGSEDYWDKRYTYGGNSGRGSYNEFAEYKAKVLNNFVSEAQINSVIEFGCGDGNQLKYFKFPSYIGFDVSLKALEMCKDLFGSDSDKSFCLIKDYNNERADLTLSLDVLFHLVEKQVFEDYLHRLFNASLKYVIIYSSNCKDVNLINLAHVKHRNFTNWIEENSKEFHLKEVIPTTMKNMENSKTALKNFYVYERNTE